MPFCVVCFVKIATYGALFGCDGKKYASICTRSVRTESFLNIVIKNSTTTCAAVALFAASFVWLFQDVLAGLAADWTNDPNYSHGWLIPPIAAYLVWERRTRLGSLPVRPAFAGLFVVAASIGVLLLGLLGAELFLSRLAVVGTLGGVIVFVLRWQHLKTLAFP